MAKVEKKTLVPNMPDGVNSLRADEHNPTAAMKNLLVSHDGSIEDKIATVKTAQIADQGRFDAAFKTLMKR
jgi:hypothetical protein